LLCIQRFFNGFDMVAPWFPGVSIGFTLLNTLRNAAYAKRGASAFTLLFLMAGLLFAGVASAQRERGSLKRTP
jgi:hypothetical protein